MLLAVFAPATATAGPVFDNGPAIPGAGNPDISINIAANQFSVGGATEITGGAFVTGATPSVVNGAPIHYFIYDNAKTPIGADMPGAELFAGDLTITGITVLDDRGCCALLLHYIVSFDFATPFEADAGAPLWFGLGSDSHNCCVADESQGPVISDFDKGPGTWTASRFEFPSYTVWRKQDYEFAFTLSGEAVPMEGSAGGVLEPLTWTLMVAGFGLMGLNPTPSEARSRLGPHSRSCGTRFSATALR